MQKRNVGLMGSVREAMGAARVLHPLCKLTAAGVGALTSLMALGNPTGGQVVGGTASISAPNANKMVIDQTSQNAIINWQQFSVGAHQYVQFIQPNSSAVVLNRVISNDPSRIFGNISANGQVFLVNPNGIYFAPGSSLDASGMLISTLDIKNNDFMQGNYVFAKDTNAPDGATINQGSMTTTANGYVVLAGDYVENDGRIQAQTGRVYLAAGASATLTFDSHQLISYTVDSATLARLAGAVNAGDIVATGGAVFMTGDVANALTATAVNNQGFIAAKSIQDHNGTIVLEATGGDLINSGRLVADAAASAPDADGGTIILRGNEHTQLTDTSRIDAAGGGTGAGGFIELSGHTLGVRGAATAGKGGHLLIDPATINITDGNVNGPVNSISSSVGVQFIANALASGNNVTLVGSNQILNKGRTPRTITTTGTGKLDLEIGSVSNCVGGSGICVGGSPTVSQHGGTIDLTGLTINIKGAFVAHAGSSGTSGGKGGHVTLGDVTAGSIRITGEYINTGNLTANDAVLAAIVVRAKGSSDDGGSININGNASAPLGGVTLIEDGGQGINVTGNVTAGGGTAELSANSSRANNQVKAGNITGTSVQIVSKGGQSHGGSVNVGNLKATQFNVHIHASNGQSGSQFKVKTGTVTAGKNASISASDFRSTTKVTTGAITAYTSACAGPDCNNGVVKITAHDGTISVGTITDGGGSINPGSVDIAGRILNVGNISTRGKVTLQAKGFASSGGTGVTQVPGTTIKARAISVGMSASYGGSIKLANLTASSSKAPAVIEVKSDAEVRGKSQITMNGNITISGKASNAFSSAMPGVGVPYGARLLMLAEGGGGSGAAHTIKINGNLSLTAKGAQFTDHGTSPCDCTGGNFFHTVKGTGGLAGVSLGASGSHGSVVVTGAMNVKGPEATVTIDAPAVKTGSITVTGTGETITRSSGQGSKKFGGSHGSVGFALLNLTGSDGSTATTITTGNITVSGKGVAQVVINTQKAVTGDITVAAAAAKGSRSGTASFDSSAAGNLRSGIGGVPFDSGKFSFGLAGVVIGRLTSSHNGSAQQGQAISVGNVSATGAGQAFISLSAKSIQTQALTVVSTKGTEKGTGSSVSGANNSTGYVHTFNGSGGVADIKIRSGNSGSHSSGVLTQNGGPVTINGAITAKGPRATVDIKGKTITVGGTVTVAGSGGTLTSTTKVTGPNGGFSTSFSGPERPTSLNLQGAASGSVNVAGKIGVKGPGLVGLIVVGGGVTLHGLSGSASAVKTYVTKDTRISTTKTTNTVSSLAVFVDDVSVTGGALTFTSAADTGDVTLRSKGNVDMASRINVNGNLNVAAVGNIFGTSNGVVTRFNAVQNQVRVGSNSSGGGPSPGVLPTASFKANAMAFVAGKSISMSGTQLTIGNGSISSVHGDAELLLGLADAGIAPAASNPNGAFIAGGSVSLGGLKLTGSYLLLQGTAVSILGPVSVPAGTLVQVVPFDPAEPMDIENTLSSSAVLNLSATSSTFNLSNQGFISLFAGDTVAVGNDDETGNVTLGANGPINIGSTNLIIDTSGTITGLSTVTSTGLVNSLLAILGPPVPPPTAGEIDPSTGSTAPPNDYKKPGTGGDDPNAGGGGGTITQDTGTASVCH